MSEQREVTGSERKALRTEDNGFFSEHHTGCSYFSIAKSNAAERLNATCVSAGNDYTVVICPTRQRNSFKCKKYNID